MIRRIRTLLAFGCVLLSASACIGDFFLGIDTFGKSTSTTNENEIGNTEAKVLPITLSQNIVSTTATLAILVETISEQDTQSVYAQYDETRDTWFADIKVLPGHSTEFILTWSEKVRDQSITLARANKVIALPLDVKQLHLDIPIDEYQLSFDADADGLSNLTETTNSTNPFDSSSPSDAVVKVEFNVKLDIPSDLADSIGMTSIQPSAFLNGKELTLSFNSDVDVGKHLKPVSDAEFDTVLKKFGALSQAIENKDTDALDRLATSSKQSDLFKRLIKNNYDRIDVSINNIRLRNIDKSITGTLQIDSIIHPNGDISSLSEKYTSRTITSRKVDGDWSKIEW